MAELAVTTTARFQDTVETHRAAFERHGLNDAWTRIVSMVTQPGVDFSHTAVHRFEPEKAADLSSAILEAGNLTFEAHSTDYQPTEALAELVDGHFFLKVGPELTFRVREAAIALAQIEDRLDMAEPSGIMAAFEDAMQSDPTHWRPYYQGAQAEIARQRMFSFSDRIRYYWTVPAVRGALGKLFDNLNGNDIPQTLVSQHFAEQEFGDLAATPETLVSDRINRCVARYYEACGYASPWPQTAGPVRFERRLQT